MIKRHLIMFAISMIFIPFMFAQEIYVDINNGNDNNTGILNEPLKTLEKAVKVANELTGTGTISIKLLPGLYILNDKVLINPVRVFGVSDRFIIEAMFMPDDSNWTPEKMPIIQSISGNNSITQMPHAVGLMVSSENVTLRGLKFIGNPNPSVTRYYPITRENSTLKSLEVSQCYFIAEKNSTPIQGGIWAHGQETNVSHCIFYNCRNGVLLLGGVKNCSITNSIIFGAYQSAIWVGQEDPNFVFNNNIISQCDFFWVKLGFNNAKYKFSNCVITGNNHYTGVNRERKLSETTETYEEKDIIKSGKLILVEKNEESLPFNYLHPTPETLGSSLNVGIFKKQNGN